MEILIESDDDRANAFLEALKRKKPENAEVEDIRVEDYDGRVMGTESYYRYLTAMQLAKIATYGGKMLEKQELMVEKQNTMLGKNCHLDKTNELLERRFERLEEEIERIKKALIKAGIDV